jgi:hypothetical protein
MTSGTRRDPISDTRLTAENAALILIDYQPPQRNTIRPMDARAFQAGAKPVSWIGVLCELQPDWSHNKTAGGHGRCLQRELVRDGNRHQKICGQGAE